MKKTLILSLLIPLTSYSKILSHDDVIKICKNTCIERDNKGQCVTRGYKDCDLVTAIVRKESTFNSESYNSELTGSYGLMQIQCSTAKERGLKYGCNQLYSPVINIRFGIKHLIYLEGKLGKFHVDDLFSSYNAGIKSYKENGIKKYRPFICKRFRRFRWQGTPEVICYKGEYINQEYVWHSRRYYDLLKRETNAI